MTTSPVTLRLFGTAAVEGAAGPITGRGTRGRRLALLALLATARGKPMARDRLLAILWPDASDDRARPLLSDSIYVIRGALGDDAIVTAGDEVRLNPDRVSSDVETFERLLAAKEHESAIAEYSGPLLDGFHVADSAEFEHWLGGERRRLADRYAEGLSALAAAREQDLDWESAVGWLRRLAAHDPYAGRVAARLMLALHASGNRAAALQHARVHATLLRQEFGADLDLEVSALVEQLKSDTFISPARVDPSPRLATPARQAAPEVVSLPASLPPPDQRPTIVAPIARRRQQIGLMGAVLVLLAGLTLWAADKRGAAGAGARPSALAPERSIAVLPFEELSSDGEESYFGDGLTEEIIGLLGRVDGLRVVARSSSFALRDSKLEARSLGDTLRVATLLEGSVRREADRVRVTAQLVDAATGYQLLSSDYDRRVEDVIELQHDIATAIVGAFKLKLGATATTRALSASHNTEAYDLYLRGTFSRSKLSREGLTQAVDFFDRAIRLDSTYAPAWSGKATTIGPMVWGGYLPREQGMPLLHAAARRALELDETLAEAHNAMGIAAFLFDWDWAAAEREFRRATALNPNDAFAHHFLANVLRTLGRFDEMIAERTRALELDPLSVRIGMMLGMDHLVAGQYDDAVAKYRQAIELEPLSPSVLGYGPTITMGIGHVYERQGKVRQAFDEYIRIDSLNGLSAAELARLRQAFESSGIRGYWGVRLEQVEADRRVMVDPVRLAWMSARAGDRERTVRNLERAYRERAVGLVYVAVIPDFEVARRDPRVVAILDAMGLRAVSDRRHS